MAAVKVTETPTPTGSVGSIEIVVGVVAAPAGTVVAEDATRVSVKKVPTRRVPLDFNV